MKMSSHLLLLGTGGTIAGSASLASDNVGYQAGVVSVADLLHSASKAPTLPVHTQQLCQIDSKDIGPAVWGPLLATVQAALWDEAVAAIVITHGTDTLEETAALLAWGLGAVHKPVVLTCAMRPASALFADGPQNLRDALTVAQDPQAQGVCVVAAGQIHAAAHLYKVHTYRLDAFDSFEQGQIGRVEEGRVRWLPAHADWRAAARTPTAEAIEWSKWLHPLHWPRVEWITSYGDSTPELVDALLHTPTQRPLRGLVVAGTGNGTLHAALMPALQRAHAAGVMVWRCSRCIGSAIVEGDATQWPPAVPWGPSKARMALMLDCLRQDQGTPPRPTTAALEGQP
ncbi:MAG: hypothetical protein RLZZ612_2466 [Pseudomonadota bacterium]|jgi:L-asparaginase